MNMLDMGIPQLQGETKKNLELGDIARMLWRRKWFVLIPLMVAILVGGVICRLLPKMYTSTAIIYFERPQYPVENLNRDVSVPYLVIFKDHARMLITDVTRQSQLQQVFEKQGLIDRSRPLSLAGRVKSFLFGIEFGKDPGITEQYEDAQSYLEIAPREDRPAIVITYTATDPVTARNVADEIGKLVEDAETRTVEPIRSSKDVYSSKADAARKALEGTRDDIRKLLNDAAKKGWDPTQLAIMYQHRENLSRDVQELMQKVKEDADSMGMERIMLTTVDRTKKPAEAAPAAGNETEEKLYSAIVKEYEDYLKKNLDDLTSRKMRAALPGLRERAKEQDKKIMEMRVELPRLLAVQEALNKRADDNSKLYLGKQAEIADIGRKLDEEAKKKPDDPTAKPMGEIDDMKKQKQALEDEATAIKAAIDKDQRTWRSNLANIKEYQHLAILTGWKVPEPGEGAAPGAGATPENPEEQNAALKRMIDENFPNGLPADVNPDWITVAKTIVSLEAAVKRNTEQLDSLQREQTELNDRITEAQRTQTTLNDLRAREKDNEDASSRAQTLFETAQGALSLWTQTHENGNIRRYPAELPLAYSSPKFTIIMLLAVVGGLAIGGGLMLLAEMADHTIKRPTDLRRVLDRPVLASIPALDIGRFHTPENLFFRTKRAVEADLESGMLFDKNYVKDIRFRSIATEQIRKLRLNMQTPDGERVRTILVTSALAGEGKSTVAANLAVAISQMIGEYVLLIDADLRRPDLHNFFGMQPKPGLSEYLEHDIDLKQLLVKTEFEKLTLLQAGKVPANSTELLSSDRMRHLVREVKSRYPDRYIILDSPPVLATSEPNVLANQVDGVILVVRAGMTPREMVEDVLASIDSEKIMGIVMNDVRTGAPKYYSPTYV